MIKNKLVIHVSVAPILLASAAAYAIPPEPAEGHRWVINNAFSDEFNGNALDTTKWRDHHRTWKGRPPAKFEPSAVSVKNGSMQIKNHLLKKTDGQYSIAGGAVQSLTPTAYHGYYEARFKASRINMSTTFWLSSASSEPLEGKNHLGESCEKDNWSQELDIAEAVGGVIDKPFGKYFRTQQQYNTHLWYRDCHKQKKSFSKGANVAEGDGSQAANNKLPDGKEVWQDFNTYAAWWKNENEVDFYLNDGFSGRVKVDTQLLEKPYSRPMQMQMVTETYNWATPYPTAEELANDQINTSYYDWVRSYFYVGLTENVEQVIENKAQPDDIFTESVNIKNTQIVLNTLKLNYLYQSDTDVNAIISVTKDNTTLLSEQVALKAGYGHVADVLTLDTAAQWQGSKLNIQLVAKGKTLAESKAYVIK